MALGKKIAQSSSSKFLSSRNLMRFLIGKNSSNQLSRFYIFPLIGFEKQTLVGVIASKIKMIFITTFEFARKLLK